MQPKQEVALFLARWLFPYNWNNCWNWTRESWKVVRFHTEHKQQSAGCCHIDPSINPNLFPSWTHSLTSPCPLESVCTHYPMFVCLTTVIDLLPSKTWIPNCVHLLLTEEDEAQQRNTQHAVQCPKQVMITERGQFGRIGRKTDKQTVVAIVSRHRKMGVSLQTWEGWQVSQPQSALSWLKQHEDEITKGFCKLWKHPVSATSNALCTNEQTAPWSHPRRSKCAGYLTEEFDCSVGLC